MRERRSGVMRWRVLRVVVALVAALPLLAVAVAAAPAAHAGGGCVGGPCIHWDTNMFFPGLNNGNPEGPVGENVTIHGGSFPNHAAITFAVVPGDLLQSTPSTFCASAAKVALSGAATSNATGAFNFSFAWPAAAGSGDWSICSYDTGHSPFNALDDGPFSVLSSSPVEVSLTKPSFQQGEAVTVTGLNWLPGGQRPITAYIGSCVDCATAPIVSAVTTSGADGSFTTNLTIPASAAPGSYFVGANGYTGLLDVGQTGAIPITIAAAIPTATTLAPTATSVASVAATNTTATSGGAQTGRSGGRDTTTLLIGLIVGLVVLVAALAGLIAYVATRRKAATAGPGVPPASAPPPVAAATPPAYRPPPGANAPYGIPDYGALPMPDWQEPARAWDPGATALPDDDTTLPGQYSPADPLSELYPSPLPPQPPQPPAPSAPAPDAGQTRAGGDGQTRASDNTAP